MGDPRAKLGVAGSFLRAATLAGPPAILLIGCVSIVAPPEQFVSPTDTVQAEVGFRSQVCAGSFEASLDGVDVTAQFSPQPPAATRPQATFSNLAVGSHTLTVSAETLQYWLLIPFCSGASDTVTFSVAGPSLGFSPAGPLSVPVGGSASVTVTLSSPQPAATTVTLSSSNAAAVGAPASVAIAPNATNSAPAQLSALAPGGSTITGSAPGVSAATIAVTVPTPDFDVQVTSPDQAVAWGAGASYTVAVESLNGFSQPVALSADDLPDGATASFSPASVTPPAGGAATATMTLATTEAVTAPGETRFRAIGTDVANRSRDDEARVTVLRKPGPFGANVYPLQSSDDVCDGVDANIVAGPRVQFVTPLGTTNPAPQFGPGYDFSSRTNCRVGFVIPPVGAQPFVNLYNLDFPPSTGADGVNSPYNFPATAIEARFSPDDSIVAIIGPGGPATNRAYAINLFDVVRKQSGTAAFFDGAISSLELTGNEVTVSGSDLSGPFSFTLQLP